MLGGGTFLGEGEEAVVVGGVLWGVGWFWGW